jgi:prefoldin subunit 5
LEKQQRSSFRRSLNSPDMESLKRKLTTTRRPEPNTRNLLPELNQYKQNNAALQTQIGSLMTKLNESRKSEKALKITLQEVEQRCLQWEDRASEAEKLAKNNEALQNSIDHLEHRLEMANAERLDAQEEAFNLRTHKSPFDATITLHSQGQSTAPKEVRLRVLQSQRTICVTASIVLNVLD